MHVSLAEPRALSRAYARGGAVSVPVRRPRQLASTTAAASCTRCPKGRAVADSASRARVSSISRPDIASHARRAARAASFQSSELDRSSHHVAFQLSVALVIHTSNSLSRDAGRGAYSTLGRRFSTASDEPRRPRGHRVEDADAERLVAPGHLRNRTAGHGGKRSPPARMRAFRVSVSAQLAPELA